jgi:outer membrane protein assembly factor BamB
MTLSTSTIFEDRMRRLHPALVCLFLLAACGGGGGGGGGAPSGPPPVSLLVSVSPASQTIQVPEGSTGSLSFVATLTGTSARPIVPVLKYDTNLFALNTPIDASVAGKFAVTLTTLPNLAPGSWQGQVSFQLCDDAACSHPYDGTLQNVSYAVAVKLGDWSTFQRDATHRGFVPIAPDPAKIKQLWTWWLPSLGYLNSVATGQGRVFLTSDNYSRENKVFALDEMTGALQWSTPDSGSGLELDPPAYANGSVYVKARELSNSLFSYSLWTVNAKDGTLIRKTTLNRGENGLAPTVEGDRIFVDVSGWSGGVTALSAADATVLWKTEDGYNSFTTPAVDKDNVYYYNGAALFVYKRSDGSRLASIRDLSAGISANSPESIASPVLGSNSNILALSGTQFTGHAGSSPDGAYSRPIVNFAWNGSNPGQIWISADKYLTQPALSGGVIYAGTGAVYTGNGYSPHFDAIDEKTGKVLWSWTPPAPDMSFHRNVVVTRNLVFVSTDQNVYALDLATHKPVWQAPFPGSLAISAGGMLVISTGASLSDGRVVAFQLLQ